MYGFGDVPPHLVQYFAQLHQRSEQHCSSGSGPRRGPYASPGLQELHHWPSNHTCQGVPGRCRLLAKFHTANSNPSVEPQNQSLRQPTHPTPCISKRGFSRQRSSYFPGIVVVADKVRRWCLRKVEVLFNRGVGQKFAGRGATSLMLSPRHAAENGHAVVRGSCRCSSSLPEFESRDVEAIISRGQAGVGAMVVSLLFEYLGGLTIALCASQESSCHLT